MAAFGSADLFTEAFVKLKGDLTEMLKPDYLTFCITTYGELTQHIDYHAMRRRLHDPRRLVFFAAMGVELHKLTGHAVYAVHAEETFGVLMSEWHSNPDLYKRHDNPFFVMEPLLNVYEHLKSMDNIEAKDEALVREYLPFGAARQMVDNNQGLSRAAGTVQALRLFPDHPDAAKWNNNLVELWDYWCTNKDLDENAGHYNSIGLGALIRLAEHTGRTTLLHNTEVKRMFERYRDQLSPSGAVPEYGDDYFGGEWQSWVYVFEAAARIYDDAAFLEAARKTFQYHNKHFPLSYVPGSFDNNMWSVCNLYQMAGVLKLPETDRKPASLAGGSLVTRRNEPGNPGCADKLILGANRAAGSSYVFCELYGRGYHAHLNRIGAVQYYEAGHVPLFHGLTRHNRSAAAGNAVVLLPQDEAFPVPVAGNQPEPGKWQRESVPVRGLITGSQKDTASLTLDKITLRLTANKEITFVIRNLRLEGPAGVRVIDEFETLSQWERSDNPYSIGTHGEDGKHSLLITVKPGAGAFYNNKGYQMSFSLDDYTTIQYDWTYLAAEKVDVNYLFRAWIQPQVGVPLHVDFYPGDVNQVPLLKNAHTLSFGNDSYGVMELEQYGTIDTKLTRRMVLTEEGVLVIVDELLPGSLAAGYTVGPLWNLYTLGDHAANWYDSPGEERAWYTPDGEEAKEKKSLLVYYATAEGRSFGVVNTAMNGGLKPFTTFAKQTVTSGKPIRFVTVLVPHSPMEDTGELAGAIQVIDGGDAAVVKLQCQGWKLNVRIGPSARTVERVR